MVLHYRAALLSSLTALLMLIHASDAEAQEGENTSPPNLDELRKGYQDATARAAKVPRPKLLSPGFKDALPTWTNLHRERRTAGHQLAEALLKTWKSLPDDSPELPPIQEEIKAVYQQATGPSSTGSTDECTFFAGVVWELAPFVDRGNRW
jgi:hypothetical protein